MKNFWLVLMFALTFSSVAYSQKTKSAATRFTSAYTNLTSDCKVLKGGPGTDDGSLCRGPGGYKVRTYFSAAAYHIAAELKGSDQTFPLAMSNLDFDTAKTRLEWRLANGKPFAVIMRVPVYAETVNEGEYFGKLMGHKLIVRGLNGVEIDSSVDAKSANANVRAREIADKAFVDGRKK